MIVRWPFYDGIKTIFYKRIRCNIGLDKQYVHVREKIILVVQQMSFRVVFKTAQ